MLKLLMTWCYDCDQCKENKISPAWGHPTCYMHSPCSKWGNEWDPEICDFCGTQKLKIKDLHMADKNQSLKEINQILHNIQYWHLKGLSPKVWLFEHKVRSFLSEFHTTDTENIETLERTAISETSIDPVQASISTCSITPLQFSQLDTGDIANRITIVTNKNMSYTVSHIQPRHREPKDIRSKVKNSQSTQALYEPVKELLFMSLLKVCPLGQTWVVYNSKVHTLIDSNKLSFHSIDGKHVFTLDVVFKDTHLNMFKIKIDNPIPPAITPVGVKQTMSTQTQTAVTSQTLNTSGSGGTIISIYHNSLDVQNLDITHLNALDVYISRTDKAKKEYMSIVSNNVFDSTIDQTNYNSKIEYICESYYALRECRTRTEELLVHKTINQKMYYAEMCKGRDADIELLRTLENRLGLLIDDLTKAISQWQLQMFQVRLPYFV